MPRFEVDWMITQGEIALQFLDIAKYKRERTRENSISLDTVQQSVRTAGGNSWLILVALFCYSTLLISGALFNKQW